MKLLAVAAIGLLIVMACDEGTLDEPSFENAMTVLESLDKHEVKECSGQIYVTVGATSGISCQLDPSKIPFEIYTFGGPAENLCASNSFCKEASDESEVDETLVMRFFGNVMFVTFNDDNANLAEALVDDLKD